MRIAIMGAAGFIGTNLTMGLLHKMGDNISSILLVDEKLSFFDNNPTKNDPRIKIIVKKFDRFTNFSDGLDGVNVVYHLISTTNPSSSNYHISDEITMNIAISVNLLEACSACEVDKTIFVSSGGTIYGEAECPISEDADENPINTYGIQKIAIEKLLYLYNYLHDMDYCIARLSNPYGPYQRPNGKLGAISTFTYRAINGLPIDVYGDGSAIRDYIYIDDAIDALINIAITSTRYKTYNIGSGIGISLNDVICRICEVLSIKSTIRYHDARNVDLKKNYLDVSRYQNEFGNLSKINIDEGILRTAYSFGFKKRGS